ncbi:spore cortex biosynthesis protein YabQ [Aquibacillus sp. 3ASR75-11]|uniref:Spore cortex biosynthesis protein YabQ n=1 Tax=Terrihalobacillus insolitus TaxID=2950438 RepID=A0A9X4AN12_9BACI|nr:spore cortex biosynthesis protein YabQ [Terrihalobacillus insolitus]MDC3414858.1 spore cortex biosynthesis protein YabQ [Terrihalobacillus insolitus]MDC3426007.1 spore cortex biosynthesis protein YabQ [Terrihalobacillus insolitus]
MTLSVQFATILMMILGGIYLGVAIETFRRFEHHWKKKVVYTYLIEISFWLLQTLILFYLLYVMNQGELRFYIFLAILCGYAAYKGLFENTYRRILERVILFTTKSFHVLNRLFHILIITPIVKVVQAVIAICLGVWAVVLWIILLVYKIIFYPIRFILGLVYRILPKNVKKFLQQIEGFYSKMKNILIKWWNLLKKKGR